MAFTDSYSFSHRFSDDKDAPTDCANYQEIIHQCSGVNAIGLTRQFFQFAVGCGYSPKNIVDAFCSLSNEYGMAYCGYDNEKTID